MMTSLKVESQRSGNLACRYLTASARHEAARVRACAAQVQPVQRAKVPAMTEQWPHARELIQGKFPVEDMATVKTIPRLQFQRGNRLRGDDERAEARRKPLQRYQDPVQEELLRFRPTRPS